MQYEIARYLNVKSASNVVWLADGKSLVFTTDISGVPQVWRVNATGGNPEQLTFFNNRIWSLYSLKHTLGVCFIMDADGNEHDQIYLLKIDGSPPVNLTDNPQAVHQYGGITANGDKLIFASNARNTSNFDICEMDLNDGAKRIVMQNTDNYNIPAALSPNGRYLLYNKLKGQSDNALWMLDRETGTSKQVTGCEGVGAFTDPVWKSDSTGFFLLTDKGSEFIYLAWYDMVLDKIEPVHDEDWDIETPAISSDDRYLAFTVNVEGYSILRIKDLHTGELLALPEIPRGVISWCKTIEWSPEGHKLAFSLASGGTPSDIWVLDVDSGTANQITCSSRCGIQDDGFVEPELIHFKSYDGLQVSAWLFKPRDTQHELLPVVVNIHGGPEWQERLLFNPLIQYLVNQGLAVVSPNVRGSTGYGKTYHHLDDVENRLDSVADINSLVAYLIDHKIADPERIAVLGVSYGGFMTLASITEYPELWAAAVDIAGIANLETFLENTSSFRRVHRSAEYGSLEKHQDILRRVSPIHKVDRILCPLLVIHGANDPRVPVDEAEQIVGNLRKYGRPVEYLRYEDEGHNIVRLGNRLECYPKVAAFLKEHLKV
ncbi:MAG: S9 family peptidase [Bacillota bacterium]|jgi:dipeptidyl aminopeptidase/acylaminoacyl peptidase